MKTFAILTASALGLAALSQPAIAGESMVIKYDDLNLTSEAGQKKLERRIEKAARAVCQLDRTRTGTRVPSADKVACYKQAKAKATQNVAAAIADKQRGG